MSDDLLAIIKKSKAENTEKKQADKKDIWLIFTMGNKADGNNSYAIPADCVKEILRDATVFPLPFVPAYVNGVLNRYGDPYVVIDTSVLEGKEAQQSFLFIVLNDESHTCLRITDVKDFFSASEKDIVHFTEAEMSDYYEGTLKINGEEVFVLKVQAIIEKVGKEIAAV